MPEVTEPQHRSHPAMPQVNHIALPVADVARARNFYQGVFGLPELARPQLSVDGAWLALGGAQLHLTQAAPTSAAGSSIGHFALTVSRSELDSLVAGVQAHGGVVVRAPAVRQEHGRAVTWAICRDLDGNLFELTDAR